MTDLDRDIVLWLNQFARTNELLDGFLVLVTQNQLLRGGVVVALLWWAWASSQNRLISGSLFWPRVVIGTLVTLAVVRGSQNFLPNRPRPVHQPGLDFHTPFFYREEAMQEWSSFPSDHAGLFIALAVATLLINRRIGLLSLLWVIVVILIPRVYLGFHYPSDILAGALAGVVFMLLAQYLRVPRGVVVALQHLEDNYRGPSYAFMFVFSFQCATLFDGLREIVRAAGTVFGVVSGSTPP
jgi:undecaprenyl-diphosphatase